MQRHGIGRLMKKRAVGLVMAAVTGLTVLVAATIVAFPVLAQQQYAATRPPGAEGSMPGTTAGGELPVRWRVRVRWGLQHEHRGR